MKTKTTLSPDLERRRMISVAEAAELKNVSVDTFKRNFKDLIHRVSKRRLAVRLGDVLDAQSSEPANAA
jgi:hypothetical protein